MPNEFVGFRCRIDNRLLLSWSIMNEGGNHSMNYKKGGCGHYRHTKPDSMSSYEQVMKINYKNDIKYR